MTIFYPDDMMQENHAALYRRISLHIAPPLVLLYFIAFLDRVNISFATLLSKRPSPLVEAAL